MSHQTKHGLIIFSSLPEFFELEANGSKPNTVRMMDVGRANVAIAGAKTIAITCLGELRDLQAPLTSVVSCGEFLGHKLVVFSWNPDTAEIHDLREETP